MENPMPSSFTTVISRNVYTDEEHDEIDNDVVDDAMPLVDIGADIARYCIEDRRCTEQSTRDAANIVVPSLQQRAQFDRAQQIHVANESQNTSVHAAAMVANSARFNGERQRQRVLFTLSEHQLQELIQCGEANVTPIAENSASVS